MAGSRSFFNQDSTPQIFLEILSDEHRFFWTIIVFCSVSPKHNFFT